MDVNVLKMAHALLGFLFLQLHLKSVKLNNVIFERLEVRRRFFQCQLPGVYSTYSTTPSTLRRPRVTFSPFALIKSSTVFSCPPEVPSVSLNHPI